MMRRLAFLFLSLFASFALSGCGPIYQTEYSYIPPHSDMGRMCAAQCVQNKNACQQMCQMRNDSCRAEARQQAWIAFKQYRAERFRHHKPVDKDVSDFDQSSFMCNNECDCDNTFNACYSTCGGQVLTKQRCVAFCNK